MVNELPGPHVQIAADLAERMRSTYNGDTALPRVVVLEGASGVGKTRMIQEVYERVRRGDSQWPPIRDPARIASGVSAHWCEPRI